MLGDVKKVPKIIYTGAFRFPDGDAAAARVLGIGKALGAIGYEVEFASWGAVERGQDRQDDGRYIYEGFRYLSLSDLRSQKLSPIKRLFRYLTAGSNTLSWLRSQDLNGVKAIIAYHGNSIFLAKLAKFCRMRGIKLIVDCTEWYDSRQLVGGRFGLVSLDNAIRMRLINPRIGSIIAISSYLEKYYVNKGCRVINIPPLIDFKEDKWKSFYAEVPGCQKLRLVYAGIPGKKDLLGDILRGISIIKNEGAAIEIHLVGPSRDAVVACLNGDTSLLDSINDAVVFHGRVSQSDVPRILSSADFSVLLRPQERYALAGFSTKLVESLAAGVPVIANRTGDICNFVNDGEEGILLSDYSPTAFAEGLKRIIAMPLQKRKEMRSKARDRASLAFNYKVFRTSLDKFLNDVVI